MSSFSRNCREFFGTTDLYEILGVDRNATNKEIKKAYHRLSLLVHPDRVSEDQKLRSTEKFKVLSKVYSILEDREKRKCYDDNGDINDDYYDDDDFNWLEYWRSIFKPINLNDIKKYKEEYIGSDTEVRDVKKAYLATKGDMDRMLEMIPFSDCDNEPRIKEIVKKLIDAGEVEEFKKFFNEPEKKRLKRHKKWEEEKKEAEQIDMEELQKQMQENHERRLGDFANLINNIEEKYGKKRKAISGSKSGTTKLKKGNSKK